MNQNIPKKLYKYRSFNTFTLRLLHEHEFFYADPKSFNDPLDCNPIITNDLNINDLELLFTKLFTTESLNRYVSYEEGNREITESERIEKIVTDIKIHITEKYSKFWVVCFAEKWECPLMWSHYADEHKGICVEFDTTSNSNLKKVNYEKPRQISTSLIMKWLLEDCEASSKIIKDTFFYTKCSEWKYECEWRDISKNKGIQYSPFSISAIHFGLRCDQVVVASIIKMYSNNPEIRFYQISDNGDKLERKELNTIEIVSRGISQSPATIFSK